MLLFRSIREQCNIILSAVTVYILRCLVDVCGWRTHKHILSAIIVLLILFVLSYISLVLLRQSSILHILFYSTIIWHFEARTVIITVVRHHTLTVEIYLSLGRRISWLCIHSNPSYYHTIHLIYLRLWHHETLPVVYVFFIRMSLIHVIRYTWNHHRLLLNLLRRGHIRSPIYILYLMTSLSPLQVFFLQWDLNESNRVLESNILCMHMLLLLDFVTNASHPSSSSPWRHYLRKCGLILLL
jgi:hypothetical protein